MENKKKQGKIDLKSLKGTVISSISDEDKKKKKKKGKGKSWWSSKFGNNR